MIVPTCGRIVWFYAYIGSKPLPAIIREVQESGKIDITLFSGHGAEPIGDVILYQEEETIPEDAEDFCAWMPYQQAASKKYPVDIPTNPPVI